MFQRWVKWEPTEGLVNKYYIDYIYECSQKLKIVLSEEDQKEKIDVKKLIVEFDAVFSYKLTDETFRLGTISLLDGLYGGDFYSKWTFFKVTNSPYLKLLSEESYGISDSYGVKHFAFIDANSILDVIASGDPTFTMTTVKIGDEDEE